jgi:hydrogenase nickel incorporation protein HypA/HybF
MSIAMEVLKIVEEHLPAHPARVKKINLKVGRLTAVIQETFKFCMEVVTKDTFAEGAEVVIEEVPLRVQCESCGEESELSEPLFICPKCEGIRLRIISGRDLLVESIEIEEFEGEESRHGNQGR